jgi:cobalt-zinc-cadmium efflux system outer membrane protein
MIRPIASWIVIAAAALMAGCASVPREAGFGDVRRTVEERTGQRIYWDQGGEADRHVSESIRSLLSAELTADAAVQIALLNNQNLQATYEDIGIAQAELVEAGLLHNPIFRAEVRLPKGEAIPYVLEVSQSFLDLLLIPLRKRVAGAAFEGANLRVADAVLNTAAQTKSAFYRAQAAEQLLEMRKTIAKATEASFDAAKRLHQAGNINDLTLTNEQAIHEQSVLDLTTAQAEASETRQELSAFMGIWGSDMSWKMSQRLPDLPEMEANAATLESLAVSQRLDLGAAREQIHAAGEALGMSKRTALVPELNVSGHVEREPDGATTVGPGIELPLPIFSQGQPAIAAAMARLRQHQKRYAALAVGIRAETRRAFARLMGARQRAEHYQRVVLPLRRQIVQQTQLQYNAMHVGISQLLEARRSEIDAGRGYVESLRDYWIARTDLEHAIGGKIPARVSATLPATSITRPGTQPASKPAVQDHHHRGG